MNTEQWKKQGVSFLSDPCTSCVILASNLHLLEDTPTITPFMGIIMGLMTTFTHLTHTFQWALNGPQGEVLAFVMSCLRFYPHYHIKHEYA